MKVTVVMWVCVITAWPLLGLQLEVTANKGVILQFGLLTTKCYMALALCVCSYEHDNEPLLSLKGGEFLD
jgi:hypothetical protein